MFVGIAIAVLFIYYVRYRIARDSGTMDEFKEKVSTRYLWLISFYCFMFAVFCVFALKHADSFWVGCLFILLGVTVNPMCVRTLSRISKDAAVAIPILISVYMTFYVPRHLIVAGDGLRLEIEMLDTLSRYCWIIAIPAVIFILMLASCYKCESGRKEHT